jgi:phenylacetate-CoA ligase
MHLGARDFVHFELVDPDSDEPVTLADGAEGEMVLTHLRHRAAPLLRFRTRDHVVVKTSACPCGRTGPRIRCVGRTDDMLIVRGVNVFPAAVREVVAEFAPGVTGRILVRPTTDGPKQDPPLPLSVELAEGSEPDPELTEAIAERLREALVFRAHVDLGPFGSLERSEAKSRLVAR